jgi:hypothetical protein
MYVIMQDLHYYRPIFLSKFKNTDKCFKNKFTSYFMEICSKVFRLSHANRTISHLDPQVIRYRGADNSLARPGKKQARVTEDFAVHISYL